LQHAGDARGAEAAITFANDKLRGQQAVIGFEPIANDLGKVVDISADRKQALADGLILGAEAALAGLDGVDEDEVGEVEPSVGVGPGRWRAGGNIVHWQAPGAEATELDEGGSEAWAAVEGEDDGA
jgi:hypothetical protein